jgi:catechol 2,3-dioxygenase-like lactoylglutathione lyase family enzyme
MPLNLNQIGQIALPVRDVDRSETFYEKVIGLRKLYRFGDLTCSEGIRSGDCGQPVRSATSPVRTRS